MVNIDLSQFDNVPAGMPPPGVTPNLIDPPSRAALPKYFALTTLPLMLVFLFLRLYTRVAITRKFGIDDGELDLHRPSFKFVCLLTHLPLLSGLCILAAVSFYTSTSCPLE